MLGVINIEYRITDEFCLVIFWDFEWVCVIFIVIKKIKKEYVIFFKNN